MIVKTDWLKLVQLIECAIDCFATGNSGDLASIVKQQDELIASIEGQIKKLRHLLLLRQQFMALISEITTFIAKYNEVIQDIEKGGKTVQEKIRRYEDVILSPPFNI